MPLTGVRKNPFQFHICTGIVLDLTDLLYKKDISKSCSKGRFQNKISEHPSFKSDENQPIGDRSDINTGFVVISH